MSTMAGLQPSFNQQHMGYAYNNQPAAYYNPSAGHHVGSQSFNLPQAHHGVIDNGAFPASQPYSYSSAPYSQSIPQASIAQPSPQQSASPQQQPHQPPQQVPTPPIKYPMAAPPFPNSPATSNHATANTTSTPSTPKSPGTQQREQQRMSLLMDINVELLQEVSRLQSEGKGGATTPQQAAQMKSQGQPSELASQEYIDALRHVQANFTYLMPAAQGDASKIPQGPALLQPPAHMPHLQSKYDQLRELFPGWSGLDQRWGHSSASPQPNGVPNA